MLTKHSTINDSFLFMIFL